MRRMLVFSGSSHPELTDKICRQMSCRPGKRLLAKFSNNETLVELHDSVRDRDIYIVQSGASHDCHANDHLMELLIMVHACKTASAAKITVVLPFFPYSRPPSFQGARATLPQENAAAEEEPDLGHPPTSLPPTPRPCSHSGSGSSHPFTRSGALVADLLTCAGASHIITLDLHDPQFQGFFDCPVDNLSSQPIMVKYIQQHIPRYEQAIIISPDAGGAKRATALAEQLRMDFALIHRARRRRHKSQTQDFMLVGNVRDRVCVIVDDMIDSGYTITKAAKVLHENGATCIYALVTHAIFSGDALQRIKRSHLDRVIVSDSIEQDHLSTAICGKISSFSVAPLFAESIRRTHHGESISMLFDPSYELF